LVFVYYNLGKEKKELKAYEKSLILDPENPSAKKIVKRLQSSNLFGFPNQNDHITSCPYLWIIKTS
jgi:hypothetical protein